MVELDVQYIDDQAEEPPSRSQLLNWANLALVDKESAQVTIRIVDETESQTLNKTYRDKDKSTNVLSFPMELPEELSQNLDIPMQGDLVICAPVVEREAKEQNKSSESHWAHMVIHGMLHLQGYDHITDEEAEAMESLEINLLQQLGIDNPYGQN